MKKKEIMLRYEMYRARIIGTTYVLQEIEELRMSGVFLDNSVLDTFVTSYTEWNTNARTKLERLKAQDELACDDIKLFLAKKVAHKIEEQSIEEFYRFGIISEKVKSKLYTEMDERYAQKLI
jgi:hypothetical protein